MSEIKFNIQQQPKSRPYLETWIPRPNHRLIQLDFAAVEPTILAQVSGCPTYRKLYGPDANPNQDVYLHVGAKFRKFKDQVLKYYNPDNPTAESTAEAKRVLRYERGKLLKTAHLGFQYGAGAPTVHSGFVRQEVEIDLEDVFEMHKDYWSPELFAVVKDYERKLQQEWRQRGGWIINPMGRPLPVSEQKFKDLLNCAIQSAAHDCLQRVLRYIDEGRFSKKVLMYPWLVDQHDETIFEAHVDSVDAGKAVFREAMQKLNADLAKMGWDIPIKGEPEVFMSLAEVKCEE